DLVEELIGDIRDEYDVDDNQARRLRGGGVEVEGLLNLHEFAELTGIDLPEGPYETAAGFVLAGLGELPQVGNSVEVEENRITVTEMDGRRIARLRIAPAARHESPDAPPAQAAAPTPAPGATPSSGALGATPASGATPATETPAASSAPQQNGRSGPPPQRSRSAGRG
ncbi:MAG TPA: transporter associated domain-containing protein, partial [Streptosporangiaceae bacterium]